MAQTAIMLMLGANSAQLQKGLDAAKAKIKGFQGQVSVAGKAMGNAFKEASSQMSDSLNFMTKGMSGMLQAGVTAFKGLTAGVKGFASAFMATGIGAIIIAVSVALMGLVAAFKRSGKAADEMEKVFGMIKGVLNFFIGLLVQIGEKIVEAFKSDAVKGLGDIIMNVANRFQGFLQLIINGWKTVINGAIGVGYAIQGIFNKDAKEKAQEYFNKMGDNLGKMAEGFKSVFTGEATEAMKKFSDEVGKAAKEGGRLAEQEDALMDAKIENTTKLGSLEIKLAKQRDDLAEEAGRTEESRQRRAEKLQEVLKTMNQISAIRVKYAYDEWKLMEAQAKAANDTSDDTRLKVAEAQAKYQQEVANSSLETLRFKRQEASVDAQIAADIQKQAEEQAKMAAASAERTRKLNQETLLLGIKDEQKAAEEKLKIERDNNLAEITDAEKQAAEMEAIWANYYAKVDALNSEFLQKKKDADKDVGLENLDKGLEDTKRSYDEKLKLLEDAKAKEWIIESEFAAKKAELDAIEKQRKVDNATFALESVSSLLSSVSSLYEAAMNKELAAAGDNEEMKEQIRKKYAKKQKTMAILQAVINGALGITKAFADLGPIAGAIAAALVAASTIAQIAVIKSQPLAKGGIAYGQTLATVGEYPGAKYNPEVIAPLNKLKSLLGDVGGGYGEVKFVIEQDKLVGILERANKKNIYF